MGAPSTPPLISVRIPAYNHERFVTETLDSVRLQSYANKEIVIIDDGSTDQTASRIEEWIELYGDQIPVTYVSRPNKGVSATINELIGLTKGDYLVGLASDDKLVPGSLQARYEYLQAHPEKMAVFGDSQVIDMDGNVIFSSGLVDLHSAKKSEYGTDEGLKRQIIKNWSVTGSVIMTRKELHEEFLFDENLKVEDRDFYLRLVARNLLGFIDTPVSAYRVHDANTCFDRQSKLTKSLIKFNVLKKNMKEFSWRDKHLFFVPLLSSFVGVVIRSLTSR